MSIKIFPYQLKKQINEVKNDYFYPSIKALKGNILEIGYGKGENFNLFSDENKVFAIDKKEKLLYNKKAIEKQNIYLKVGIAENIPFEDEIFNAVVFSFVLCSVDSIEMSLKEIYRVLRKGGKVVLLEHIKSDSKMTLVIQKMISGIQSLFVSCRLGRDPRLFINKSRFKILKEKVFNNNLEPYLFMELKKL